MAFADWIRFQRAFGYGTVRAAKALQSFGSPMEIFSADEAALRRGGLRTEEIARIHAAADFCPDRIREFCEKNRVLILTPDDEAYPARVREIYSPPAVLYAAGCWENLNDRLCIAVVGTRQMTGYGEWAATKLSSGLAEQGVVTVSGLAAGIDSCCHSATVAAGGKTIAVQGCGIDVTYPASNEKLKREILQSGGAVITEFEPGTEPVSFHFPIRNRIIAGLCQGTMVVEGRKRSGSLITAGFALTEGRDVFAVPGNINQPMSDAPNRLIRQGAKMVHDVSDILQEYEHLCYKEYITAPCREAEPFLIGTNEGENTGVQSKKRPKTPEPAQEQMEQLNDKQRAVLSALSCEPCDVDEIVSRCKMPVSAVLSVLTQLEIFGIIKIHAGHRFSR